MLQRDDTRDGASGLRTEASPHHCTTNGCPMEGTETPACNNMGYCKPTAPNADCSAP
jgi:hypothetical protein